MILINLLPHREMARKQARQSFNISLGVAVALGAVIAGMIYLWYQYVLSEQEGRNAFLTTEIRKLDNEIKEVATLQDEISALKARQEAVENLQADRNMPVRLLNEAVRQLPDGVFLKGITQENQNVLLQGMAQSNERVSELLRNLSRNSEWIATPELVGIKADKVILGPKEQQPAFEFTVRVQLRRASDVAAEAASQAASAGKRATSAKGA